MGKKDFGTDCAKIVTRCQLLISHILRVRV